MNQEKILATHLNRKAVVYARQSTLRQFHDHKESTLRQYGLKSRAIECGWDETQIVCIDEDVGQSGASADWRQGFQRLANMDERRNVWG
jgi:DNA invertase Pin-like site-specific DNA recombinase